MNTLEAISGEDDSPGRRKSSLLAIEAPGSENTQGAMPVAGRRRGHSLSPTPRPTWATTRDSILKHEKERARRGRLVTFFRNGDPHYKGLVTSVTEKAFFSFDALLGWLNEKISMRDGVRHILNLTDGTELRDVKLIEGGEYYVASSTKRIIPVIYGDSKERYWINQRLSAGRVRRTEKELLTSQSAPGSVADGSSPSRTSSRKSLPAVLSPPLSRSRVFTILSNTNRDSMQKVILNPKTTQSFEEMLKDITQMIRMQNPPVKCLYTAKSPYKKIMTYTQILRDFATHEVFLACGAEVKPLELKKNGNPKNSQPTPPLKKKKKENQAPVIHRRKTKENTKSVPKERQTRKQRKRPEVVMELLSDEDDRLSDELVQQPTSSRVSDNQQNSFRDVVQVNVHGERREFYAPRNANLHYGGGKPDKRLSLNWVYGYRGKDGKNNLHILKSGELLYNVASIAILYDQNRDVQRHYQEHTEDITCIAVHPNKDQPYIATGQLAGKETLNAAHVRIWDSRSLNTYAVVGIGTFQVGVSSVSFSVATGDAGEPGDLLVAVDEGEKHILSVWDWSNDRLIAKTTASSETVVWASFHPQDHRTIVSYGKAHIYFWQLAWDKHTDSVGRLTREKIGGDFENEGIPKFVTSLAFSAHGDVISGDSSGRILVWRKDTNGAYVIDRRSSEHLRTAHTKSVFALYMLEDGTLLSGGGQSIKCWDSMNYYQPVKERQIPEHTGFVRALAPLYPDKQDGPLFIGTTKNMILEGTVQDKCSYIVQGHCEELWALAVHPKDQSFVTAGYDQQVCKWSASKHKLIWRVSVEQPCLSVAFDPHGQVVALGTTAGRFIILNAHNGMHVTSVQVGLDQLDAISFSPDGELLAMGSHDCNIYIYSVMDEAQVFRKFKQGILKDHRNFITHIDWSLDSSCLRSVSGDYDLLFWNVSQLVREDPEIMRDKEWASDSCILGFNVHAAWNELRADDDLNTSDRSNDRSMLMVGDNYGHIRLYRYPCIAPKAKSHETKMCSSHVTKARFTHGNDSVITTGGTDASVMQWSLTDSNSQS